MVSITESLPCQLPRGETIAVPGLMTAISAVVHLARRRISWRVHDWAHTSITEPLLTLTEKRGCAKVAASCYLPVITDAGAGYGDPLHVMRCVREFEAAGIAASTSKTRSTPNAPLSQNLEHIVPSRNSSNA